MFADAMTWRPPELPPMQKMPRRRKGDGKPGFGARAVATIAGLTIGASGLIGAWRALNDATGQSNAFGALAALLPAVLLIRYAITGQIKL